MGFIGPSGGKDRGQYQYAGGIGGGTSYIAFNDIPEGIYKKNGASWAPEIRANMSDVWPYLGALSKTVSKYNNNIKGDNASTTASFTAKKNFIYIIFTSTHGSRAPNLTLTNLKALYNISGNLSRDGDASRSTCWRQIIARATISGTAKVVYRQYDQYAAGNMQIVEIGY